MIANVLSIAGSDPSGGAGIQADLKTFSALGCYGMAVITALTAQNTVGVSGVHVPPPEFMAAQIDAIFTDIRVDAVKIGMLASGAIVEAVAKRLEAHGATNIVLDPVLVATSGDSLGSDDVVEAMLRHLVPLATLVTPNLPEAARLTGLPDSAEASALETFAHALVARGAQGVLIKGGHLDGPKAADVLLADGHIHRFDTLRVDTLNTHGTGCTLSSAIAAHLAQGQTLEEAVGRSKNWLTGALVASNQLDVGSGRGHGPVHHFYGVWKD